MRLEEQFFFEWCDTVQVPRAFLSSPERRSPSLHDSALSLKVSAGLCVCLHCLRQTELLFSLFSISYSFAAFPSSYTFSNHCHQHPLLFFLVSSSRYFSDLLSTGSPRFGQNSFIICSAELQKPRAIDAYTLFLRSLRKPDVIVAFSFEMQLTR